MMLNDSGRLLQAPIPKIEDFSETVITNNLVDKVLTVGDKMIMNVMYAFTALPIVWPLALPVGLAHDSTYTLPVYLPGTNGSINGCSELIIS